MSQVRVIKKYPNRRLYDTEVSSYITLEDVRNLVVQQIPIQVVDAKTEEDLTHTTLMQIIIESETKGPSIFSTDSLQQMIRLYGGSMQQMFKMMMDQGMAFLGSAPNNNLQQWQALQQQWFQTWTSQMNMKPSSGNTPEERENKFKP